MWPTSAVIDAVFIPLYVVLLVLNARNVFHHGRSRTGGFISLLIFALVHLAGNVILVVEYTQHYTSVTATVWGYILQSVGLSFLVSASIAFFARARACLRGGEEPRVGRAVKLLNLVNLAALVCVITGYTSTSFTDAQGHMIPNVHLPAQTKVGAVLYVLLALTAGGMALLGLKTSAAEGNKGREAKKIKIALLVACPLMIVRAGYATYTVWTGSALVPTNIWVKLVLQYIAEYAAVLVYTALGFVLPKPNALLHDIESVESGFALKPEWNGKA